MQKIQLINSLIASAVVLASFTPFGGEIAQAQRRSRNAVPLLRGKCVNSGLGSAREQKLNVSIGKAVYDSEFYLGPGYRSASLTCKIQPDNGQKPVFQTLNLGFGMRDNDIKSPGVEVRVYLDGNPIENYSVAPSQKVSLSLDVRNASNVAIEAVCASPTQYCDRVYFFNSSLEPLTVSTQNK
jgi:hypothetical protein